MSGSLFSELALIASRAVDIVYGEDFDLMPQTRGADVNMPTTADPDRPATSVPVKAAFIEAYARAFSGARAKQGTTNEMAAHSSNRPMMSVERSALPYDLRSGDLVRRCKTGFVYRLAEPRREDTPRLEVDLNLISNAG